MFNIDEVILDKDEYLICRDSTLNIITNIK